MARQYWVRGSGRVAGPYTAAQLRDLAAAGQLRPQHEVSGDQVDWSPASQVPGLSAYFGTGAAAAPASPAPRAPSPAPLGLELPPDPTWALPPGGPAHPAPAPPAAPAFPASPSQRPKPTPSPAAPSPPPGDELRLADLIDENRRAQQQQAAAQAAAQPPGIPGGFVTQRFSLWEWGFSLGWKIAAFFFMAATLLGCSGVVLAVNESLAGGVLVFLALIPLVGAVLVPAALTAGSWIQFTLSQQGPGLLQVRAVKTVAFVPVSTQDALVRSGDRLACVYQLHQPIVVGLTSADVIMVLVVLVCCAAGFIPGPAIFYWWLVMRDRDSGPKQRCTFRMQLETRDHPRPITVYEQNLADFSNTRIDRPRKADEIVRLFQRGAAVRTYDVEE